MGVQLDYKKELIDLTKKMPESKLKELIDFAQFLKLKKEILFTPNVIDSAEYIKKLRTKEGKRVKSGKQFIKEIIEWQKSTS